MVVPTMKTTTSRTMTKKLAILRLAASVVASAVGHRVEITVVPLLVPVVVHREVALIVVVHRVANRLLEMVIRRQMDGKLVRILPITLVRAIPHLGQQSKHDIGKMKLMH